MTVAPVRGILEKFALSSDVSKSSSRQTIGLMFFSNFSVPRSSIGTTMCMSSGPDVPPFTYRSETALECGTNVSVECDGEEFKPVWHRYSPSDVTVQPLTLRFELLGRSRAVKQPIPMAIVSTAALSCALGDDSLRCTLNGSLEDFKPNLNGS